MLGFHAAPLFLSRRQRTDSKQTVPHGVVLLGSNPPCTKVKVKKKHESKKQGSLESAVYRSCLNFTIWPYKHRLLFEYHLLQEALQQASVLCQMHRKKFWCTRWLDTSYAPTSALFWDGWANPQKVVWHVFCERSSLQHAHVCRNMFRLSKYAWTFACVSVNSSSCEGAVLEAAPSAPAETLVICW